MTRFTAILLLTASVLTVSLLAASPQSAPGDSQGAEKSLPIPPDAVHAADAIAHSPRHGEWMDIELKSPDGTPESAPLHTYVVYPERKENAPVVLVIHEIFGLTDWVRAVADQLAAEGFIAVAPDLLSGMGPKGGGTEELGDKAVDAIRKLTPDQAASRLDAALNFALLFPAATKSVGCIGFCWGGSTTFAYAARRPDLNAAVVYYGTGPIKPDNSADADAIARINCPILGLYAGDDARVNSTLQITKAAMADQSKSYITRIYDGAGHGFLRQSDPAARDGKNREAAQSAWSETLSFLRTHLESPPPFSQPAQ